VLNDDGLPETSTFAIPPEFSGSSGGHCDRWTRPGLFVAARFRQPDGLTDRHAPNRRLVFRAALAPQAATAFSQSNATGRGWRRRVAGV